MTFEGPISPKHLAALTDARVNEPHIFKQAHQARVRRSQITSNGRLFLIAADHPARGALGAGGRPNAMADRHELLQRMATAISQPGVDGVLGSSDILDDLALLGLLDDKVVIGTTNRGGIQGAAWELDDRMTAYRAQDIADLNMDGGKMLLRIENSDPSVARTIEECARVVTELAERGLMAMVEPLPYELKNGKASLLKDDDALLRACTIGAGLGPLSGYTWLKVPAWSNVEAIARSTTQPVLILGGDPGNDVAGTLATWAKALQQPTVRGLVIGRALLYPPDGVDIAETVGTAAALVASGGLA